MTHPGRLWATLLPATAVALACLLPGSAEEAVPPPGVALIVSDVAPPAIDSGFLANEPPRDPHEPALASIAEDPSKASYVPGRVIVKFRAGASIAARLAATADVGGRALARPDYANFDLVAIDPAADPEAAARDLADRPDVEYAQASYVMTPDFVPTDPRYRDQWNFPAIDMERAWDINQGASPSIVVGVLDTGLAFRNAIVRYNSRNVTFFFPDGTRVPMSLGVIDVPFAAATDLVSTDRIVAPRDFLWDNVNPFDLVGHGTHVAGTIGQLTNNNLGGAGMAFNVRIMSVKVISSTWDFILGTSAIGTDDVVARGIRYAVDNGAKILNMSFGRTGTTAPVIEDALRYAVSEGAFAAISAGNDFERGNPTHVPAALAGRIDGVVSVASVGRDLNRAFYSSTGAWVEIAAPGGDQRRGGTAGGVLQQTLNDAFFVLPTNTPPRFDVLADRFFQGTSMAAPHVAGFAALLMQQGITNPAAIEEAMKRYATDRGSAGRDNEYGAGLINPRATLRGLGLAK